MRLLVDVVKTARPRQWIKNLALYAALVFSGFFFFVTKEGVVYFWVVTQAAIVFSALTSAIYILNDIIDAPADRQHPFKKNRPIAAGRLPINLAAAVSVTLLAVVLVASFQFSVFFRMCLLAYFLLQMAYVLGIKHIPILELLSIAAGFVIRIYAGAVVVNLHMNVWFLLTVISAALFLAVGKRQSERTLLSGKDLGDTRKSLKQYSQRLLDQYTGMFANATWLTYALFAFQFESAQLETTELPASQLLPIFMILPRTLQSQKFLMLTVPIVIFGVMRYLQLIYEKNEGESPERVLLGDRALVAAAVLFGSLTLVIIYLI
jgi:4-hydroxybenzoate polyprenyltransferase